MTTLQQLSQLMLQSQIEADKRAAEADKRAADKNPALRDAYNRKMKATSDKVIFGR